MLTLSTAATLAKNRIGDTSTFLMLLEIEFDESNIVRVVNNTENIQWANAEWVAFPFDINVFETGRKGEVPKINLKVSNVQRYIQSLIEPYNGGVDKIVKLYVVHSENCTLLETAPTRIDTGQAEIEVELLITETSADNTWVNFTLGSPNYYTQRFPKNIITKNFCRWRYKSPQCGIKDAIRAPKLELTSYGDVNLTTAIKDIIQAEGDTGLNYRKLIKAKYLDGVAYPIEDLPEYHMIFYVYYADGAWWPTFPPSSNIVTYNDAGGYIVSFVAQIAGVSTPWSITKGTVYEYNGVFYVANGSYKGVNYITNPNFSLFTQVDLTTCPKTITACRDRGNSSRFGGFPSVGRKGVRL